MNKQGLKIIISGPSGSGKGTIVKELIKDPQSIISVSATTREPRTGEVHGEHYFFTAREDFETMIKEKMLLEHAEFCGNYYGTPKAFVDATAKSGKNVILEIEVEGALQVKAMYPEAIFIFVIPPSLVELRDRLVNRKTETIDVVEKRLKRAKEELLYFKEYDYVVVNNSVEEAVKSIQSIVEAESQRSSNYTEQIENIIKER